MQQDRSVRSLWLLVLTAGVIMGVALGIRNVQGLYLVPITVDKGWSREAFSLAIALQNLVWGLAQPFTGMIADRFGAAKVIFVGALVYAGGLVITAYAASPAEFAFGNGVLVGIALSGTSFGAIYGALSRLVPPQRQSWALGVAGAIGGMGQLLTVPATQQMLQNIEWALSLLILAGLMVVVSPLSAMLRENAEETRPAHQTQSMGDAIREAMRHRGFILLNIGFVACGFQLAFIAGHFPAYLADKGMDPADGGIALTLIALGNVIGTYLCGVLGGVLPRKYVLSGLYFFRAGVIASFLLLPLSSASVYAFSFIMGLVWLGTVPLTTGLVSQIFGVRYIGTLFGIVFFGHQVGSFFGVWLGGYIFDQTNSYEMIWFGSILLGVFAGVVHLPINDRQVPSVGLPQEGTT